MRASLEILRRSNLRHLREHPRRALLTVAGIAAGVCLLLTVRVIDTTLRASVAADARGLAGSATAQVTAPGNTPVTQADELRVSRASGVAEVVPLLHRLTELRTRHGSAATEVVGVPGNLPTLFSDGLGAVALQLRQLQRGPVELLASAQLYGQLDPAADGQVSVQLPVGVVNVPIVRLARGPFAGVDGGSFALVRLTTAQIWFHEQGRFDVVYVRATPGTALATLTRSVYARLHGAVLVSKPGTSADAVDQTFNSVATISEQAATVALFVAIFVVFNTLSMAISERRHELATMLATGATPRMLCASVLLEAAVLGLIGAIAGCASGLLLARLLLGRVIANYSILPITASGPMVVSARDLAVGLAAGPLIGMTGALFPALRIFRASPLEGLRQEAAYEWTRLRERRHQGLPVLAALLLCLALGLRVVGNGGNQSLIGPLSALIALMGVALLLPALIPLALRPVEAVVKRTFGPAGRIGADGVRRAHGRATLTAGGIAIAAGTAIGIGSAIGSFQSQVDKTAHAWYSAPLYVATQAPSALQPTQPLVPAVGNKLAHVPGVEAVYPMRLALLANGGHQLLVYAFPLVEGARSGDLAARAIGIDQNALLEGLGPDGIVVSREMKQRLNLHVGSYLTIPLPGKRQRFRVSNFFNDLANFDTLYLEYGDYRELTHDQNVDRYAIFTKHGVSIPALQSRIERLIRRDHIAAQALTGPQVGDLIVKEIAPLFSLARAIEAASLLIAALIVATTMFTAVYEREREFALQRALGWRSRDLARTVLVESAILGAVGAAVAIPIGIIVGLIVKFPIELQLGWGIPFVFPVLQVIGITAAAVVVAVAASIYPSGLAARVSIAGALRGE